VIELVDYGGGDFAVRMSNDYVLPEDTWSAFFDTNGKVSFDRTLNLCVTFTIWGDPSIEYVALPGDLGGPRVYPSHGVSWAGGFQLSSCLDAQQFFNAMEASFGGLNLPLDVTLAPTNAPALEENCAGHGIGPRAVASQALSDHLRMATSKATGAVVKITLDNTQGAKLQWRPVDLSMPWNEEANTLGTGPSMTATGIVVGFAPWGAATVVDDVIVENDNNLLCP